MEGASHPYLYPTPLPRLYRCFGRCERRDRSDYPGTVAYPLAQVVDGDQKILPVEHPTGEMTVVAYMDGDELESAALLRTARKLFDGTVYPLEK